MVKRKFIVKNYQRKKSFIISFLFLLLSFGIGYAALSQNLSIAGSLNVSKYNNKLLYNVLKKEALSGDFAKEYTGEHQDSYDASGSEKIYYYYGDTTDNNVLFGNYCWQMVRTTDTGGVKMIYNGSPVGGKCGTDRESNYFSIGSSKFNTMNNLASVGYMNNENFTLDSINNGATKSGTWQILYDTQWTADTSYYFSSSVTYSNGRYTLDSPQQVTNYVPSHWYTCLSYGTSCSRVFYVYSGNDLAYGTWLENGQTAYDYKAVVAKEVKLNEDGTYSLVNSSTISYPTVYSNSDLNAYIFCDSFTSLKESCDESNLYIAYADSLTYGIYYSKVSDVFDKYLFGSDVEWDGSQYKLLNTSGSYMMDYNLISKKHYTCLSSSDTCDQVSYVYSKDIYSGKYYLFYMTLTDGYDITTAVNTMLNGENVNRTDSTIKKTIDEWYESNLNGYSGYLEDTIFCNDRSITSYGSLSPENNSLSNALNFSNNRGTRTNLGCSNITDSFSMKNNKAKLKYPVGLLTADEVTLAQANMNNFYLKINKSYWLMTPSSSFNYLKYVYSGVSSTSASSSYFVRPVISLKPGIEYISGMGSMENPYVIDTGE